MAASVAEEELKKKSWDDYLEKLILVFEPVLCRRIRASQLVLLIDIKEVKDKCGVILKKEVDLDFTGAAMILLEAIRDSSETGKWQMFIDAIKDVEDTVILQILLEEEGEDCWLNDEENLRIISNIFSKKIQDHLNLEPLLPDMLSQDLITETDTERLMSMLKGGLRADAVGALLLIMHRHHPDWYNIFMGILCDDQDLPRHQQLARIIDPEFCTKREKASEEVEGEVGGLDEDGAMCASSGGSVPSGGEALPPPSPLVGEGGTLLPSVACGGDTTVITSVATAGGQCPCCPIVLEKVSSLEANVSSLEANVSSLEANVSSLEANVSSLKANVSSLEAQITLLTSQITTLVAHVQKES